MGRITIDFGIDLGTTNSEIAVLRETNPEIIQNNRNQEITPSAVFIDKRGMHVGLGAKGRMEDDGSEEDVYIEFKRKMGTDHQYRFKTSGKAMRPEEISAEVLKSLRGDVQQSLGEDPRAAVITVPAAFEQKQCAATSKAGELAGFLQCPLLQEPVAAALAYGFQADVTKEYWLVYDFGGGTFDAAIMKAEDGTITVVNNGGENYLGGSNIDWAIVEQLIIPELIANYNLPDFSRGNKRWRIQFVRLKNAAENAKIELSRKVSTYIESRPIEDADGKEIKIDFELTRDALIGVAEPFIMQSVEICKRVLQEKNLAPNAIEKVILVGGPTKAPYFREILHSSLGIPLDYKFDPLTVVARGAAIFAGTQRIEASPKAVKGQFTVTLSYKPMGPDTDPRVLGKVSSPDGVSIDGFTIEFVNRSDGAKELIGWRSGKVTLKADGAFRIKLKAEKGIRNTYGIELLDKKGGRQTPIPDVLVYTVTGGAGVISDVPNTISISVGLHTKEAEVYFKKGEPLPAKKTVIFRTAHDVKKGEGSVLTVPVVEGENDRADRNRRLGALEIKGTNIRRDVPAGTEIEVTLNMDKSRLIRVKAYIPILDEEYEGVIVHNEKSPDQSQLQRDYDDEIKRLEALQAKAGDADSNLAESLLDGVADAKALENLENLIANAKGESDAANMAEKQLLEMKVKLDQVENALKWPALVAEANESLEQLEKLIAEHGNPEQQDKAEKLREQVEELVSKQQPEPLRTKIGQLADLQREILFSQPGFWVGYFNKLMDERDKMTNQEAAERLFNKGQQCIDRGTVQGLRNVIGQLLELLPREVAEAAERWVSSLLKG